MRYLKEILFVVGVVAIPAGVAHFSIGAALIVFGVILVVGAVLWHLGERK